MRFTVVSAVSADEKKAEAASRITKMIACSIADVSKIILLYYIVDFVAAHTASACLLSGCVSMRNMWIFTD